MGEAKTPKPFPDIMRLRKMDRESPPTGELSAPARSADITCPVDPPERPEDRQVNYASLFPNGSLPRRTFAH